MKNPLFRRFAAFFCAFLLLLNLAFFPLRARAAASTLAVVTGSCVLGAFLMSCGVYPYLVGSGESWSESLARQLVDLYNIAVERDMQIQLTASYLAGRLVNGVVAVSAYGWERLRSFAQWVKDTYLPDGTVLQTVVINEAIKGLKVPAISKSVWDTNNWRSKDDWVRSYGIQAFNGGEFFGISPYSSADTVAAFRLCNSNSSFSWRNVKEVVLISTSYFEWHGTSSSADNYPHYYDFLYGDGTKRLYYDVVLANVSNPWTDTALLLPLRSYDAYYSDIWEFVKQSIRDVIAENGLSAPGLGVKLSGNYAVPESLPETASWGGLAIEGVGAITTAPVVEQIIDGAISDGTTPIVQNPVIDLEGVSIDVGTGVISPDIVVVSPESIPLAISDYAIPSLSSVFPFSIPWDIVRIWQALDAEPRFPLQDFSLTLPASPFWAEPPNISFSLEAFPPEVAEGVENLAAVVRAFLLVAACVGFLLFISRFIKF